MSLIPFSSPLSWALLGTSLITVMYLALEPYVRRRDPHTLISGADCSPVNGAIRLWDATC